MARWDRRTRLTAALGLRDETGRGLASASRGFNTYLSGMGREAAMASQALSAGLSGASWAAAAGMGAAFLTFAGSAITRFAEIEMKWLQVTNLMRKESEATKNKIFADLEDISTKIGQPMELVIDTAFQVRSAGATPENIAQITEMANIAGMGAIGDPATIGKLLQGSLNVFGGTPLQAMNVWLATAGTGVTTMGELAQSMGPVMQQAGNLGISLASVGSATAQLTKETLNTSVAATQLRGMLAELSREGSKGATFFEQAAGVTFPEFIAQGNSMADALKLMGEEGARQGVVWSNVFASQEAALAAATLASDDYFNAHRDFLKEIPGGYKDVEDSVLDSTQVMINAEKQRMDEFRRKRGEDMKNMWDMLESGANQFYKGRTTDEERYFRYVSNLEDNFISDRSVALDVYQDELRENLKRERNTWAEHYTAIARMDWQVAQQRLSNLQLRSRATPAVINPALQAAVGGLTTASTDWTYTYGTPLDPNFGVDTGGGGGGGRATTALEDIALTNRELLALMQSGQALTVRLDANIDESIILRADTVQRASGQVAARMGNQLVNRVRSG